MIDGDTNLRKNIIADWSETIEANRLEKESSNSQTTNTTIIQFANKR